MREKGYNESELVAACRAGRTEAFAALVERYQGLVCSLTYSAAGRLDVSEELAQEAFVRAWRNLGQLEDAGKFRAWLCSVTRSVILNYYRRRKRERVVYVESVEACGPDEPSKTLISREEEAMMNTALMRLPETYREPLVLFYRQEQSVRQVAELLGEKEATIRVRLHRGRQLLRDEVTAMVERGLEKSRPGVGFTKAVMLAIGGLAVGGAATAQATSMGAGSAGGSATAAGGSAAAAGAGLGVKIGAAVAALALGVSGLVFYYGRGDSAEAAAGQIAVTTAEPAAFTAVQVPAADRVETAGTAGTEAAAREPAVEAVQPGMQAATRAERSAAMSAVPEVAVIEETEGLKCRGVVVDYAGQSVAGARLLLYHDLRRLGGIENRVVEETRSNGDGSFAFRSPLVFVKDVPRASSQDVYVVLALHPKYAFGWQTIQQGQESEACELVLTEPQTHTIQVTDSEENPLAGVRVWLYQAGDRNDSNLFFQEYLSLATDIGCLDGLTDEEGMVTIPNLPKTQCCFRATLDGYADGLAFPGGRRIRMSRGASVRGLLLDENDQPVEGARIRFQTDWMWKMFWATTDAEGVFVLRDLPAKGWDMSPWGSGTEPANGLYKVTVHHERVSVPEWEGVLRPGDEITDLVMRAYRDGTTVRCRIVEDRTERPLAGVRVQGEGGGGRIDGHSDADGVFTFRAEPGRVSLFTISPPDEVYMLDESSPSNYYLSFEANGEEMDIVMVTPPIAGQLISLRGEVVDMQGAPVGGAVVYAEADKRFKTSTAVGYIRSTGADAAGRFEIKEVPAGLNVRFYVETKDRSLAGVGVYAIPADPNTPIVPRICLAPTRTCHVVLWGKDGQPVCDTALEIRAVVGGEELWGGYGRTVRTDGEGNLAVDGIVPGVEYYLRDTRFNRGAFTDEERDRWFEGTLVLIP